MKGRPLILALACFLALSANAMGIDRNDLIQARLAKMAEAMNERQDDSGNLPGSFESVESMESVESWESDESIEVDDSMESEEFSVEIDRMQNGKRKMTSDEEEEIDRMGRKKKKRIEEAEEIDRMGRKGKAKKKIEEAEEIDRMGRNGGKKRIEEAEEIDRKGGKRGRKGGKRGRKPRVGA